MPRCLLQTRLQDHNLILLFLGVGEKMIQSFFFNVETRCVVTVIESKRKKEKNPNPNWQQSNHDADYHASRKSSECGLMIAAISINFCNILKPIICTVVFANMN